MSDVAQDQEVLDAARDQEVSDAVQDQALDAALVSELGAVSVLASDAVAARRGRGWGPAWASASDVVSGRGAAAGRPARGWGWSAD